MYKSNSPASTYLNYLEGSIEEDVCEDEYVEEGDVEVRSLRRNPPKYVCINKTELNFQSYHSTSNATGNCSICLEDAELLTLSCSHRFCSTCLDNYISITSEDFSFLKHLVCYYERKNDRELALTPVDVVGVKCPERNCNNILRTEEVSRYCSAFSLRNLNEVESRETVRRSLKNFCPSCQGPAFAVGKKCLDGFQCLDCDLKFCALCEEAIHSGMACELTRKNLRKEKLLEAKRRAQLQFEDWKQRIQSRQKSLILSVETLQVVFEKTSLFRVQDRYENAEFACFCPGCSVIIEKNLGCDHMHCTRCDLDFSFLHSVKLSEAIFNYQRLMRIKRRS